MDVEQAKKDLLDTMANIDKGKLSLTDLKLYAETLQIISNIDGKSYYERIFEMFGKTDERQSRRGADEGFALGWAGGAL